MQKRRHIARILLPTFMAFFLLRFALWGAAALAAWPPEPQPVGTSSVVTVAWGQFQPQDWVTATPFTATVTVTDTQGVGTATAEFRTSANDGSTWTPWSRTNLTATASVSTTAYLTVTGLTMADATSLNHIQFRVTNTVGVSATSLSYIVEVDTTNPSAGVSTPVDGGAYNSSPSLGGTASDATSRIQQVEVNIQRTSDSNYWDGAVWVITQTWLATTGTDNWSKSSGLPTWADGVTYTVRARATDNAGHVETPGAGSTFLFDTSAPTAPNSLAADPVGWTNADNFDVGWSNPADVSGIAGAYYKLDSAPTSATDGTLVSGNGITQTSLAVGTDGSRTLYVWLKDRAGNVDHTRRSSTMLYLDTTAPANPTTMTSTSHTTATWSADNTVDATWSGASDADSGVEGYATVWDTSAGTVPATSLTTTDTSGTSPVLAGGNSHYLHVRAKDKAGNWAGGASHLGPFYVDTTAPGSPTGLTASPSGWTHTNGFDLQWGNPAELSGVNGAYYRIDAAPGSDTDGTLVTGAGITTATGLTVSGDGQHTVYLWLQDVVGNVDSATRVTTALKLDTAAPGVPIITGGDPTGWSNVNAFTVTWSNPVELELSGIAGAHYKLNTAPSADSDGTFAAASNTITDIAVPAEGKHSIYLWLQDNAGNTNYSNRYYSPDLFWYDGTPPTTGHALDGPLGQNGWYTGSVTITLSAADQPGLSGVADTKHQVDGASWQSGTSFAVAGEGTHQADYYSVDVAGNEEISHTVSIPLDLTPPTVTHSFAGSLGNNGWYTSTVTVTLHPTDTTSGVAQTKHRLDNGGWQAGSSLGVSSPGTHTVSYFASDQAGNEVPVITTGIKLDLAAPTTTYTVTGVAGADGWYRSDPVTVTLAATDSISGPDQTFYRLGGGLAAMAGGWTAGNGFALAGESAHSFEFYSTDQAGNGETPGNGTVKIDTTPPGVPVNPVADPAGWSDTDSFTITWNNASDFSGVSGAYYKLNSAPTFPTDGILVSTTNVITGISVGSAGQHDLFLWLQDRAGNVDDANKNAVPKAFSYDHTPPDTTASVAGTLGDNNWYVTPVTVTFNAQDQVDLSGVAETRYRVGTAPTQTGASLVLNADDKHTVRYWSVDVAGNEEAANSRTIRVDRTAPAAPINPQVTPTGWSGGPCFLVSWTLPPDTSGVQGVYYRFGAPPSADTDGTYVAGTGPLTCALPPSEGKHDLHVWLKDNAGNLDFRNRADMLEAVWYDATPPTTTFQVTGTLGAGGWYTSNVTVTLASTDTASGVVATHFRLDGGPWQVGNNLALASEGTHTVDYYADDVAGNVESTRQALVRIDSAAPSSAVNALPTNQSNTTFGVSWVGDDGVGGSGIAQFDLQAKDGMAGPWQDWLTGVVATSANFNGQRGHVYFFRSRSRDVAGNQEDYPGGDQHPFTFVQSFLNGDFSAGGFAGWVQGGGLGRGVIQGDGHTLASATTWMAQLGDPSYGSGSQGNVPPNTSAYIYQEIDLPAFVDLPAPTLSFWYRVFTYDVVYGCPPGQTDPNDPSKCKVDPDFLYDSFDVTIEGDGINTVRVLRDGNPDRGTVGTLVDMGWRQGVVDLSAYAGRRIRVRFANWNRPDAYYNTWTYLDDVVVTSPGRGGYLVYLPLNTRNAGGFLATGTLRSAPAGPGPRR